MDDNSLQYDCLYYRVADEKVAYQELSNIVDEEIPYCFRPNDSNEKHIATIVNAHDGMFSFEQLNNLNISATDLFTWSTPIDLVDKYQFYLDYTDFSSASEIFYNCTKPWFGSMCQYAFEFDDSMFMNDIIQHEFNRQPSPSNGWNTMITLSCYVHMKCNRGGPFLCLDWREVCNGRVDCIDDDTDEASCFELELNECNENEYRCHNGLCIPVQFWEHGYGDADCLDRSDEYADVSYPNSCYRDPTFRCEEHTCRTNWHNFACGDGQCVQTFDKCHNGRDLSLIRSILTHENSLNENCFIAMTCLTKLVKEIHGKLCDHLFFNNSIIKLLEYCPHVFQFPMNPIYSNHIRFLYENISVRSDFDLLIIPDYICYDDRLCDCLVPNYFHKNSSCLQANNLDLTSIYSGHIWIDMILSIEHYFRSCLGNRRLIEKLSYYGNSTNLYQCFNSSKLISKHRIVDENIDCCMKDDENYLLSCSINVKYRVQCPTENKCLSSLHTKDDCLSDENDLEKHISFPLMCDGLGEFIFKDLTGKTQTDETECGYWPCNNIYSRCDGFWTCRNGEDEEDCHGRPRLCESGKYLCVSILNHSLICLPSKNVGDGVSDCLGSMDELDFCRRVYPFDKYPKRFRCQNSDICLSSLELCNNIQTCPEGDDEDFCQDHRFICEKESINNRTIVEDLLCRLSENEQNRQIHFSIKTSSIYPLLAQHDQINKIVQSKSEDYVDQNKLNSQASFVHQWPWYCNRGLRIRIKLENNKTKIGCLCPPSYYGNQCQYQNQRISLTLGLVRANKRDIFLLLIMLIDNDNRYESIISYNQYEYIVSQSCGMKLNRYLLYSTRPKDASKNYSIRIDALDKQTMSYRGSWYLPIPFIFLPVNRVTALLHMPQAKVVQRSSSCLLGCYNGECVQYLNKEYSFCRCFPGWSGIDCNIRINCRSCSSDSLCVGSSNNRSICLCPLTKFGPRCLLKSSCPENACLNDGQCVPIHRDPSTNNYSCICSNEYYGPRCQYRKFKLDIIIENIPIPSYVLAFFITVPDKSEPQLTIMIEKLTLFQQMVTFRVSISYHMVVVKSDEKYYLAVIQKIPHIDLSTKIDPSRECSSIGNLFNTTMMRMSRLQRIKYYHLVCQMTPDLHCFLDEYYFCLCTSDRHSNCFKFNPKENLQCSTKHYCENNGRCLQDHPTCPSTIICVCSDCFFGNQCQFYAKGLGLTLDEILGYEISSNLVITQQKLSVKLSAALTMIMFSIGLINGLFSILTFHHKKSQEIGCGIYLLASSITSLIIIILFTFKFWFLLYSYSNLILKEVIVYLNCMFIEPCLKVLLHVDNWLNGCIACERAFAVFKGISFNKQASKIIAKWIVLALFVINIALFIPQLSNLRLFYDTKEERTWCVIYYSALLNTYNSFIMFFHFFAPFIINLFSALSIIVGTAHQQGIVKNQHSFTNHFKRKLNQHKHLLISPVILIVLSLPRLIISLTLDCKKLSNHLWLYLSGYFISFMPSVFIFTIFVLPSPTYKRHFQRIIQRIKRRISLTDIKS